MASNITQLENNRGDRGAFRKISYTPRRGLAPRPSNPQPQLPGFTIHEDDTATVEDITTLEDQHYEAEMEKVYKLTNKLVKEVSFFAAGHVLEWALPVAARLDRILNTENCLGSLKGRFECFRTYVMDRVGYDTTTETKTAGVLWFKTCDVHTLCHIMEDLWKAYLEVCEMQRGAEVQYTAVRERCRHFMFLAGYCAGKGFGFESPDVLIPRPDGEALEEGEGVGYYHNLAASWDKIFSIYTGYTTSFLENSTDQIWVNIIWRYIFGDDGIIDFEDAKFLISRWWNDPPFNPKREFGRATSREREAIEGLLRFYRGEENIPRPIWQSLSNGTHRSRQQVIERWARRLGGRIRELGIFGEKYPIEFPDNAPRDVTQIRRTEGPRPLIMFR